MKPAALFLACVLAAVLGAAETPPKAATPPAAAKAAPAAAETASLASLPPSPLVTRMKQIRACLDEVFKVREPGGALPDLRLNPFHLPGTPATATQTQAVTTPGGRATAAPETEPVRLRRLVGGLTWGRITDRNGQELVTIAGANYREGESFGLVDPILNTRVIIRVVRISGNSLTLRLGNSEYTVTK